MLTFGSMFTGLGGIDLGFERAGLKCIWQAEIDPWCSRQLARLWPGIPNHGDVTLIDYSRVRRPRVLVGGFMCTDLSHAGNQAGLEGETRSGITFREFMRAIRELRPDYVLVENVSNLLSGPAERPGAWFGTVLRALAEVGYHAEWDCVPAAAVGAPHLRDRVFVVAYPHRHGQRGGPLGEIGGWFGDGGPSSRGADPHAERERPESGAASARGGSGEGARDEGGYAPGGDGHSPEARDSTSTRRPSPPERAAADAAGERVEGDWPAGLVLPPAPGGSEILRRYGAGARESYWPSEPDMGRLVDGVPAGVDAAAWREWWRESLKAYGNAAVPQVAEFFGRAIRLHHERHRGV